MTTLVKSTSTPKVLVNDYAYYTLTLTTDGLPTASTLTDVLPIPAGSAPYPWTIVGDPSIFAIQNVMNVNNQNLIFNTINIPAGTYTVTIRAFIPGLDSGEILRNFAIVRNSFGTVIAASGTVSITVTNVLLSETTPSVNVDPGTPIFFTVTIEARDNTFVVNSFSDTLPTLTGGGLWQITSQSQPGTYSLQNSGGQQNLIFNQLGVSLFPNIYSVTIRALTNLLDAGQSYTNQVTSSINGTVNVVTATATIAVCIHSSSKIKMADGSEKKNC